MKLAQIFAPLLGCLFFLCQTNFSQAQTLSGRVLDGDNKPIAFTNIGVLGKSSGTVSDFEGLFDLTLKERDKDGVLRFSAVGYESKDIKVADIDPSESLRVVLTKAVYELPKVEVEAYAFTKEKTLGNRVTKDNVSVNFASNSLGTEVGLPIKVKQTCWIKEASFGINKNDFDSIYFRVNVYDFKNDEVGEKLLKEDVIVISTIKAGVITVDLADYNIVAEDNVMLSLEWVRDFEIEGQRIDKGLNLRGGINNGPCYYRFASQSDWTKVPKVLGFMKIGVNYNVLVAY